MLLSMKNKSNYILIISIFMLFFAACEKEGPVGNDGDNSLIKTSEEPVGSNCTGGGLKVETGLDLNRNNLLDDNEIGTTNFICNENQLPLVYAASASQSDTSDPVGIIIKNELGIDSSRERITEGKFKGSLSEPIDQSKTIIRCNDIQLNCMFSGADEISLANTCGVNAYCDDYEGFSL